MSQIRFPSLRPIYDTGRNEAWVSVGCDHDTPTFAVASLRRWWEEMGKRRYPEARRELFVTADAGGSNHITQSWRGRPLRTFETIVDLTGNTRTEAGLRVRAELDTGTCPKGVTATDAEMEALSLHRNERHGDNRTVE